MKTKFVLIAASLLTVSSCIAQCPVKGDKDNAKFQHLDSLKNRSIAGNDFTVVDINTFFSTTAFTTDEYVRTTGYIKLVKWGGAETCNCHSKSKDDEDYHIEVIPSLNYIGKPMICEINRFNRCVTYEELKAMVGKQVTIEGWIFEDIEHKQNSVLANPSGTNDWRETDIEIHPVIKIQITQ